MCNIQIVSTKGYRSNKLFENVDQALSLRKQPGLFLFGMYLVVVFLSHANDIDSLQLMVHLACPEKSVAQVDMFANMLDIGEDTRVLLLHDGVLAEGDECNCEEVDKGGSIFKGKDALPNSQRLEELKLLSEQQCEPPEAIEEGIYLEFL